MTKKLEELFDVETSDDVVDRMLDAEPVEPKPLTVTEIETAMTKVDKIDAALPSVRDLETSDREMDEIAQLAQDTFKDLMDLGMNVEARFSGEIFGNAAKYTLSIGFIGSVVLSDGVNAQVLCKSIMAVILFCFIGIILTKEED